MNRNVHIVEVGPIAQGTCTVTTKIGLSVTHKEVDEETGRTIIRAIEYGKELAKREIQVALGL